MIERINLFLSIFVAKKCFDVRKFYGSKEIYIYYGKENYRIKSFSLEIKTRIPFNIFYNYYRKIIYDIDKRFKI